MSIPLLLAAPAAIASLAYLNAKTHASHDFVIVSSFLLGSLRSMFLEKRDQVNFFYALEKHANTKATANHPFLVFEGKTWTYKETYEIVLKYGTWLKASYSIAPKEIVAMDFMNSVQFIFLWFGIWSLGACPAFINYNLTGEPLLHCLKTSTARIVFVDAAVRSQFTQVIEDIVKTPEFHDGKVSMEVVTVDAALEHHILSVEATREPDSLRAGVTPSDMAILIYTSGTTGLPKAAIVSWGKCRVGGSFISAWLGMKQSDRFYTCMPLYHTSAAVLGLCTCLALASTCIIGRKFSTRTFWSDVRNQNATMIQYVGETCRYLLTAPSQLDADTGKSLDRKHNVRVAFGNGMRPDVWSRFKERFGVETIAEFYAATEAPGGLFNLSSNDFSTGAIGRSGLLASLVMGASVALVQIDWETETPRRFPEKQNLCSRVKDGEPGEMLYMIDPANIEKKYQGYFGNSKATNGKIMRDVFKKGDAWFRTGDVVRRDAEGFWWFCDRLGDTFRWKSENVSTSEVSEALGMHSSIHEANVYGVELPHHDGRAGCAAIVLGSNVDQNLLDSIAKHVRKSLPRYAVPLFLRVTKENMTTGNNKQQKHHLRLQGVDPDKIGSTSSDRMFWMKGETYVGFEAIDWAQLQAGRAKL